MPTVNTECTHSTSLGEKHLLCFDTSNPGSSDANYAQILGFEDVNVDTQSLTVTHPIVRTQLDKTDPLSWTVNINGEERSTANHQLTCMRYPGSDTNPVFCTTEIDGQRTRIDKDENVSIFCEPSARGDYCVMTGHGQEDKINLASFENNSGMYTAEFKLPTGQLNFTWPAASTHVQ